MKKRLKPLCLAAAVILCFALIGAAYASGAGDAAHILRAVVGLDEPGSEPPAVYEAAAALAQTTPTPTPKPTPPDFIVITPRPVNTQTPTPTPTHTYDPASGSDITTPAPVYTPQPASGSNAG